MAFGSYSVLDILLPSIIIIMQDYSQALTTCKCLWSILWRCVYHAASPIDYLLFSLQYMGLYGPFQYRWLEGYIYSSCYYHHQIGSIHLSHCYDIFPWLCAWDICYIILCHLLYVHSGKTGNLFSLLLCNLWWMQIVGYVLACRSYSFVCTLHLLIIIIVKTYLKILKLYNAFQIYFVECLIKIQHILSVFHYTIYGTVCFLFTHFACDDW